MLCLLAVEPDHKPPAPPFGLSICLRFSKTFQFFVLTKVAQAEGPKVPFVEPEGGQSDWGWFALLLVVGK